MPDVIIIGAGAAGISAGRKLARRGVSFMILEASPRIGGRAFTDRTSLPGHWEQGCQWFHCADVNPLVPEAEALGWKFEREDHGDRDMNFLDGHWQSPAGLSGYRTALDAAFQAIEGAAAAGRDLPITEVLPDAGKWQPLIHTILGLLISEDPERVSALGYADYADTGQNWIVTQGLGALIERLAQGLPIHTGTAVTAVEEQASGVRVETTGGSLAAKAVIVTASTNLLLSGAIRFRAPGTTAVFDQMAGLPCGAYEKVALAFDRLPFDPADLLFFSIRPAPGVSPMGFQIVAGPQPKLIAHVGGDMARELTAQGPEAMIALARDRLSAAFGSAALKDITAAAVTGWTANAWVKGAYSYAKSGHGQARKAMIAANTGPIRFAGEAFSLPWHATVHGAWQSGHDAAGDLADMFGA